MPVRPLRVVALALVFVFMIAACGGDSGGDDGGGSGASADLEKWIPEEVDGKKVEKKEATIPPKSEDGSSTTSTTTTTAPAEGDEANANISQLGTSLATSIPKVEGIAVGEIPASSDNALAAEGMPSLFIGALQSSEGAKSVKESLSSTAPGANLKTEEVDGIEVSTLEFDMSQQLQGQQLPEGTPALPTITISYFTPEKNVVVVVFSTESPELAQAAVKASIESGK